MRGLKCPGCGKYAGSTVANTRISAQMVNRRRQCRACSHRFNTEEAVVIEVPGAQEEGAFYRAETLRLAKMYASGSSLAEVGKAFGLSYSAVRIRLDQLPNYESLKRQSLQARKDRRHRTRPPHLMAGAVQALVAQGYQLTYSQSQDSRTIVQVWQFGRLVASSLADKPETATEVVYQQCLRRER